MHLIVPFAAPLATGHGAALPALATPALAQVQANWQEASRDAAQEDSLSPPHERAWAAALGIAGADGCLPWAARQAAADGVAVGEQAWGLLTPVHWRVGSDGVHLVDPDALALGDGASRALFDAVQPLFEREGYTLAWGAALRWYAAHPSLQGLATASIDRVIGRNIDDWLPRQPQARPLRRLQNEAQMLLHHHPVNQAREAAGALAVNSVWLSGCGAAQPELAADAQIDARLRGPALQGDGAAWATAWGALDAQGIAPLHTAAASGQAVRLTLCGERCAVTLAPQPRAWWQRIADRVARPRADVRILLESL